MTVSNQSNRSNAAKGGLNLTLNPIESFIFSGIQTRFLEVFEAKSIWATSSDKTKLLQRLFGSQGSGAAETNVTYPYAFLTLNTVSTSETRGSIKALSLYGIQTSVVIEDQKRAYRVKVSPTDFSVAIEYVTNNYQNVLRYVNTWMFAREGGWLKFDVSYGNAQISVGIEMDANVTLPQREADLTNVQEYTVTSNLTILGYMSFSVLQEQQVIDTVQVSELLGTNDSTVTWAF